MSAQRTAGQCTRVANSHMNIWLLTQRWQPLDVKRSNEKLKRRPWMNVILLLQLQLQLQSREVVYRAGHRGFRTILCVSLYLLLFIAVYHVSRLTDRHWSWWSVVVVNGGSGQWWLVVVVSCGGLWSVLVTITFYSGRRRRWRQLDLHSARTRRFNCIKTQSWSCRCLVE